VLINDLSVDDEVKVRLTALNPNITSQTSGRLRVNLYKYTCNTFDNGWALTSLSAAQTTGEATLDNGNAYICSTLTFILTSAFTAASDRLIIAWQEANTSGYFTVDGNRITYKAWVSLKTDA